jgi:glycosyltransferase involved in cell wall biosynthesis
MRVLMLNRKDSFSVPGGDTLQMVEAGRALERLGAHVHVATVEEPVDVREFDVVHVFNWEQVLEFLSRRTGLQFEDTPLILTSLFMNYVGHWYEEAADNVPVWRVLSRTIGRNQGRSLYERWQKEKFRRRTASRLAQSLRCAARIVVAHSGEIDDLCFATGLGRSLRRRCIRIPNGINRDLYACDLQPSLPVSPGYVLQVARIQRSKNQVGLIRALYDLPVPIVFVGQPSPYEPDYVQTCYAVAGARGGVHFFDPRAPEEMPGVYAGAAVHVLPSFVDCLPLTNFEAAAAGCRVVTTTVGGTKEYFGMDAWYCDPWDRGSIRSAVLRALASPSPVRLQQRVLEQFTWDAVGASTLAAYESALGRMQSAVEASSAATPIV